MNWPRLDPESLLVRGVVVTPRWLLLAVLVYAPWAYGCTVAWSVPVLNVLLGMVVLLWLLGCGLRGLRPRLPPVFLAVTGLLVLQAWWMALNAKFEYEAGRLEFSPLVPVASWAPGSIHRALSVETAVRVTALLAAALFVCDLVQRRRWQRRVLLTMALTGVSLALLGLVQRAAEAPGIFWGVTGQGTSFFATYVYHANAGAFLNLTWPLVAALGLRAWRSEEPEARPHRVFWLLALATCLAAVCANASRAATLLAVGLLLTGLGALVWRACRGRERSPRLSALLGGVMLTVLMVTALALLGGLEVTKQRWKKFTGEFSAENPRVVAAQVCLKAVPEAGAFGFGPGTFRTAFPYQTGEAGNVIPGVWLHAHNDYLETLLEWGWLGALLWAVWLFGGFARLWRDLLENTTSQTSQRHLAWGIASALTLVVLHAAGDYPLQVPSLQLYAAVFMGIVWRRKPEH